MPPKKPGRLPFEPETEAQMIARFDAALEPRYNPAEAVGEYAPSKKRQHVFDWPDEMRMIVSVDHDTHGQATYLHASFSSRQEPANYEAWRKLCIERLGSVSGRFLPEPDHRINSPAADHYFFEISRIGIPPE